LLYKEVINDQKQMDKIFYPVYWGDSTVSKSA
jgi:hypothetical protein